MSDRKNNNNNHSYNFNNKNNSVIPSSKVDSGEDVIIINVQLIASFLISLSFGHHGRNVRISEKNITCSISEELNDVFSLLTQRQWEPEVFIWLYIDLSLIGGEIAKTFNQSDFGWS